MSKLSNTHKQFIVKKLACFEQPSEVIELVKEQFGVEITKQQVSYYNPDNNQGGRELAPKWVQLFHSTRDKFIEGTIDIPIAHKSYRVRELQKNYKTLKDMGNIIAANQVLEQVSKEMGGAYESFVDTLANRSEGEVNFYQQINQRIMQINQKG